MLMLAQPILVWQTYKDKQTQVPLRRRCLIRYCRNTLPGGPSATWSSGSTAPQTLSSSVRPTCISISIIISLWH